MKNCTLICEHLLTTEYHRAYNVTMLANMCRLRMQLHFERRAIMNENEQVFGKFIEERRKALGITLRGFAAELDIAPAYMSDIEKGRRYPPDKKLDDIARILKLEGTDKEKLLDMAALTRVNTVSPDLPEYIMDKDLARVALRRAKAGNLSDEGWQEVIDLINKKIDDE
ncbi:MAG: helix-turn-helix transcriptional regulator [Parabacteroides sp.]|nr:helix-turn-helix transcriptional regulator [Parabacteroides sp.]